MVYYTRIFPSSDPKISNSWNLAGWHYYSMWSLGVKVSTCRHSIRFCWWKTWLHHSCTMLLKCIEKYQIKLGLMISITSLPPGRQKFLWDYDQCNYGRCKFKVPKRIETKGVSMGRKSFNLLDLILYGQDWRDLPLWLTLAWIVFPFEAFVWLKPKSHQLGFIGIEDVVAIIRYKYV